MLFVTTPFRFRPFIARAVFAALAAAFATGAVAAAASQQEIVSQGAFKDAAGSAHSWRINTAHALIWDGEPYLPVGGRFQARSWDARAGETEWQADVAALQTLKEKNVVDLLVQPARGAGITSVPVEKIQRLLDYLDAQNFSYGVSLSDGPRDPLIGYVVRPGAYRQAGVSAAASDGGAARLRFAVPDLASALFFAATPAPEVVAEGQADIVAEGARVTLPPSLGATPLAVFLVPERIFLPGNQPSTGATLAAGEIGLPNLWDGFDSYRDALLVHLGGVKWGRGLRFFVDALGSDLWPRGDADRLIPSSAGFRAEWAAYLQRRYRNSGVLERAWALSGSDLQSVDDATYLIPLWSGGKGLEAFYHRQKRARLAASSGRSAFWSDLAAFKNESVRGYMNTLAGVLKREVANVPVIYRARGDSPLFARLPAVPDGFDGLGMDAYGEGVTLVTRAAGHVYGQAAQAGRTLWLPVTAVAPMPEAAAPAAAPGYASRAALFADLDWLQGIGAKGFFVDSLNASAGGASVSLVNTPDQLGWLRDYKTMLLATSGWSTVVPRTVFYPRGGATSSSAGAAGPGGRLVPLPGGGWWLPSDLPAAAYGRDQGWGGSVGHAYSLETETGTVYYLWNPVPRIVHLRLPALPKGSGPAAQGPPIQTSDPHASLSRNVLTLHLGPQPISVRNLAYLPAPQEAYPEMIKEVENLIASARAAGDFRAASYTTTLGFIKARHKNDNPLPSLAALNNLLTEAHRTLRAFAFMEAEATTNHGFDEATERDGASNGRVLLVAAPRPAGATPASATYTFDLAQSGSYHLWLSAALGDPSQVSFRMDGQSFLAGQTGVAHGASYANGLVWRNFGAAPLAAGRHTLELSVGNGSAIVDALLVTRDPFTPDGPNPPPVRLPPPAAPGQPGRPSPPGLGSNLPRVPGDLRP